MTNELPSLDDAAGLAQGIARGMGELCEDPYGEPAATELERGQELYEQGFGNPVAFVYKSMESYARAVGDLLYGTGEVSRDRYGLAFSSAAVARSACEYAGRGWWLAEPRIPVERRIGRTAHLVERSYNSAKGLLDPGEIAGYEADNATLLAWARRHRASESLPNATDSI